MTNSDKVHYLQRHPAKRRFHTLLFEHINSTLKAGDISAFTLPGKEWLFEEQLLQRQNIKVLDTVEMDKEVYPFLTRKSRQLSKQFPNTKIRAGLSTDLDFLKDTTHNGYSFVWNDRMASFYYNYIELLHFVRNKAHIVFKEALSKGNPAMFTLTWGRKAGNPENAVHLKAAYYKAGLDIPLFCSPSSHKNSTKKGSYHARMLGVSLILNEGNKASFIPIDFVYYKTYSGQAYMLNTIFKVVPKQSGYKGLFGGCRSLDV